MNLFQSKKTMAVGAWMHGGLSLFFLLVFLVLSVIFPSAEYPIVSYLLYFAKQVFSVLSPALTFSFVFLLLRDRTVGKNLFFSLFLTLPDFLTYGVMTTISAFSTYEVGAAILLGVTNGIFGVVVNAAMALAMSVAAAVTLKIRSGSFRPTLAECPAVGNFESPESLAFFLACLPPFLFLFIQEIVQTVSYLCDYAGDYQTNEILFMILCYFALLAEFLLSYLLSVAVVKKFIRTERKTEVSERENKE